MRNLLTSCLLALATPLATQPQSNLFEIYPAANCTNFTSRGGLGANAGEVLLQVPCSHFVGVGQGDTGSQTSLLGFNYVIQDQNASTPDPYHVVVRSDNHGVPNCAGSGVRSPPQRLPPFADLTLPS